MGKILLLVITVIGNGSSSVKKVIRLSWFYVQRLKNHSLMYVCLCMTSIRI